MNLVMTLAEWCQENDVTPMNHFGQTAVYIPDYEYDGNRSKLWQLFDYRVSSVVAGTIWLVRRK